MVVALIFVLESLFVSVSRVNIYFLSNFMGGFTRPKETENLNGILYLFFVCFENFGKSDYSICSCV